MGPTAISVGPNGPLTATLTCQGPGYSSFIRARYSSGRAGTLRAVAQPVSSSIKWRVWISTRASVMGWPVAAFRRVTLNWALPKDRLEASPATATS